MKSTLVQILMPAVSLFVTLVTPFQLSAQQVRYSVIDLGPAGNPFSQAAALDNFGLVAGVATAANGSQQAVVWLNGIMTDIGKPGLGGPNSGAGGVNEFGQVLGVAETSAKDPNNENFCGYGTGLKCVPFVSRYGGPLTSLATLGGTNATFGAINNLGEVAGIAENSHRDPACPGTVAVNGTGPQLYDFEAVIWGPMPGQMRALPPLSGDTVAMALGINDHGQVVGTSGTCANTVLPGFESGPHAVLWERDGSVHDLGNLGGTVNTALLGVGTTAFVINNQGLIAGQAVLPGNVAFHPFLWTRETGMIDLGVLSGDLVGAALGMNQRGVIVGASVSAPGPETGNPRAFIWRHGVMSDLNTLVPSDSPLYLLTAFAINDGGEIAGFGVTSDGDIHGFVATPSTGLVAAAAFGAARPAALSDSARKFVLRHWTGER